MDTESKSQHNNNSKRKEQVKATDSGENDRQTKRCTQGRGEFKIGDIVSDEWTTGVVKEMICVSYALFVDKVIPELIQGLKFMKSGRLETKVIFNQKQPNGFCAQVVCSPNHRLGIDLR